MKLKKGNKVRPIFLVAFALVAGYILGTGTLSKIVNQGSVEGARTGTGFDQYGYNETARIFNGTGASWSLAKGLPADYLGAYAKDKLVMKWNAAWDACVTGNEPECLGAWTDNEWNGMKDGSGSVWHYKIIWVGAGGNTSPYWLDGGYSIWGTYEVIMDQGTFEGVHTLLKATPNGYGVH